MCGQVIDDDDEDSQAGCRTAVNDLVFIVDGSWSVGYSDFDTAKNWLINITSSFDIGPAYTQVAVVQYSDLPRLEFHLGQHRTNQQLISALKGMKYLGGNTQTGKAIQFATENVFPSSQRTNLAKNKIAIVVTDGKSQDDVVEIAAQARAQDIIMFAVGVGSEITKSELVAIANSPSTDYVLYAEDYTTIERIKETMQQKICEESVCPTRIPVASRDEKGFELLLGMKIHEKGQKIIGSLKSEKAYLLTPDVDVTEDTRDIFPEGLPPSYVFVATIRLKAPETQEVVDLWRILSKAGVVQAAVTLDGRDTSVIFTVTQINENNQVIKFKGSKLKELFDERWHQLKILVQSKSAVLFLDDSFIEKKVLEEIGPIFINGKTQVVKKEKSDETVTMEVQKLRLYCDPEQSERETACEIYSVNDPRCPLERVPTAACQCPEGQPGTPGIPGPEGDKGPVGQSGVPGPEGKTGPPGIKGEPGPPGVQGEQGLPGKNGAPGPEGLKGGKGHQGQPGIEGRPGIPGFRGSSGPPGPTGLKGERGMPGPKGAIGLPGLKGESGTHGLPGSVGPQGSKGIQGEHGLPGPQGLPGIKGQRGDPGLPGLEGLMGIQGPKGLKGDSGDDGLKGDQGMKGEAGQPGPSGIRGAEGSKGAKGEKGEIGDSGNKGPEGKKGEAGMHGLQGPRGFPGEIGPQGRSGIPGIPGKPGKSLTDDHVLKLCSNLLREQLPSLLHNLSPRCQPCEGKPGFPGMPGIQGKPGDRGPPGYPGRGGRSGYPGLQGLPGPQGMKGDKGPKGDKGSKGENGIGDQGPPGAPGLPGINGSNGEGLVGPPGSPGKNGVPGTPGKRGFPGTPGVCDLSSCLSAYGVRDNPFRKGPNF
ncbi:collagen alpha-1(XXI) chain-like [Dendropsophus ebraccatus]|uniref:collagen alpha-1(XXI) chain-like n=1 Tax=Dendropsophus ebraccatus TaxID=150705 RepID=UPI003831A80C